MPEIGQFLPVGREILRTWAVGRYVGRVTARKGRKDGMSMRAIDADKLSNHLLNLSRQFGGVMPMEMLLLEIKNAPTADAPRWIPVTERMPEREQLCLVNIQYRENDFWEDESSYEIARWDTKVLPKEWSVRNRPLWAYLNEMDDNCCGVPVSDQYDIRVVAWCELPEPYCPEAEKEEKERAYEIAMQEQTLELGNPEDGSL